MDWNHASSESSKRFPRFAQRPSSVQRALLRTVKVPSETFMQARNKPVTTVAGKKIVVFANKMETDGSQRKLSCNASEEWVKARVLPTRWVEE